MMGKAAARAKRRKKKQTVHKLELIATHDRANDDQEHSRFCPRLGVIVMYARMVVVLEKGT